MIPIPRPSASTSAGSFTAPVESTADSLNKMSVILFQTYLSTRQVVINTELIAKRLNRLLDFMIDDRQRGDNEDEQSRLKPKSKNDDVSMQDLIQGAGIGAAVMGIGLIITNLEKNLRSQVEDIVAYLAAMRKKTLAVISSIPDNIGIMIRALHIKIATVLIDAVAMLDSTFVKIEKLIDTLRSNRYIDAVFKGFGTAFELIGKVAKTVYTIVDTILAPIFKIVTDLAIKGFELLKTLGRVGSKIFIPLQILLSAIDFINGFVEGYEKGGLVEGIKVGLEMVFDGIILAIGRFLRDGIAWIAEYFGAQNFAASFSAGMTDIIENVKNVFSSILDLFHGIFTLDGKMIWDSLKTGFSSLFDLVMNAANTIVSSVVALIGDVFNLKFDVPFDFKNWLMSYIEDTKNKIISIFDVVKDINFIEFGKTFKDTTILILQKLGDAIVLWIKDLARSVISSIPGGEYLSNKMLGPADLGEDDVAKRAAQIARERAMQNMTLEERMHVGLGNEPTISVTDNDIREAKSRLSNEGYLIPESIKIDDTQFDKIDKLLNNNASDKIQNIVTNNMNVSGGGKNGSSQVVILSRSEKASSSNPTRRGGGGW